MIPSPDTTVIPPAPRRARGRPARRPSLRGRLRPARAATLIASLLIPPGIAALASAAPPDLDAPFALRNQLPLNLLFLDPTPAAARLVSGRAVRFTVSLAYESTLAASDHLIGTLGDGSLGYDGRVTLPLLRTEAMTAGGEAFVVDSETLRAVVAARFGIAPRFEVAVEVPVLSHSGGFLDSGIDAFHDRFGFPDGGRNVFARDQFQVGYVGHGEEVFFDRAPGGAGLGDVVVSGTGLLRRGGSHAASITASASAKVPTGDAGELRGSGSADFAAALRFTRAFGRATVHGGFAAAHVGPWSLGPGIPLDRPRSYYLGATFVSGSRSRLILQALRSRGPFPRVAGSDLGRAGMEIAAGFRHHAGRSLAIEYGVIENLEPYYNVPDVGVFLAISNDAPARRPWDGATP